MIYIKLFIRMLVDDEIYSKILVLFLKMRRFVFEEVITIKKANENLFSLALEIALV